MKETSIDLSKRILSEYSEVIRLEKQEKIVGFRNEVYYGTVSYGGKTSAMIFYQVDNEFRAYHESDELPMPPHFHMPSLGLLRSLSPTNNRNANMWRDRCEAIRSLFRNISQGMYDKKTIDIDGDTYKGIGLRGQSFLAMDASGKEVNILSKLTQSLFNNGFAVGSQT